MTKSTRKKVKKTKKTARGQTKAAEYINSLLRLHKLQEVLLKRLHNEIR